MNRHAIKLLVGCLIFTLPSWLSAAELPPTVLGNSGEVYFVQAGSYGELFPQGDEADAERSLLVIDVLRPGDEIERLIVPTTLGAEVEGSPRLLYSKESGRLNVLWESRLDSEVSLNLARLDGDGWSDIEQLYFNADGILPELAITSDSFHVDLEGESASIRAERQALHLVWLQENEDDAVAKYRPILFLNGVFIGWEETFTLRHLSANDDDLASPYLPQILRVSADDDADSVTITFGSSTNGRLTSYTIGLVPMELVHFSDLIRDLVLDSDFDPEDIAGFADSLGVEIIGAGHSGRGRGRSRLTVSVIDFVASGVVSRILETAADYESDEVEALADDLRSYSLELTRSLYSGTASETKNGGSGSLPAFEIDVSDLFDETDPVASHVLELRRTVERPVPEADGDITLYTSDDGRSLLAVWPDAEEEGLLWYTESKAEETAWSESRPLSLGDRLTLEQAHQLLQERIR